MNQLASLLMGMLSPGTNAAAGLQPGSTQTTGGTDGSAFQALLMESLGETTQQVSNPASWAGQQLGGVESADPESEDQSTDTANLLGSISMASSLIGAADVAPMVAVVEPSETVASAELDAAPKDALPSVFTATAPITATTGQHDVSAAIAVDSDQMSPVQTTTETQNVEPTVANDATAAQSSVEAAPLVESQSVVDAAGVEVNETIPHAAVAPVRVHRGGSKASTSTDQQISQVQSATAAQTVQSEVTVQNSTAVAPSLPEVQAPMIAQTSADYQQMKLKLKIDARVAHDGDVKLKEKLSVHFGSTTPELAVESVKTEKQPVMAGLSTAKLDVDLATAVPVPVVTAANEVAGSQHSEVAKGDAGLAVGASGIQPSMERSVEGALRSEGFHAPERVIEQKVIHQFVQAAKVQMTDGGANMTLRLDPPHLGVIQMNVSAQQGSVVASIQTSTEAARHALQSDMTSLKQSLADAGIVVDSINVSLANTPDQPGAQYAGEHGERRGHASHRNGASFKDILDGGTEPVRVANRTIHTAGGFDHLA